MEEWKWFFVDFFQAMAAGLLVGGTYGLMCVGLGIIFGVMRVVNFAHGDFMMLGMYVAYYLVTGFGVLAFLGPYASPIVGAVLARPLAGHVQQTLGCSLFLAELLVGEIPMVIMAVLSLATTPHGVRTANGFSWGAMVEVAVLFVGIFITMVPPLALLSLHGAKLGLDEPWQYFWLTGSLSAFLDNAPTYLVFFNTAGGQANLAVLLSEVKTLAAISCGAVFLGAMTYIGNAPNFMVKSIAETSRIRMPSFFGYMVWSVGILGPLLLVMSLIFLR